MNLKEHKKLLRENSAYSGLRDLLFAFTLIASLAFIVIGVNAKGVNAMIGNNEGLGFTLIIVGPIASIIQYFVASVYFDIADASLNTSRLSMKS